MNNVMEHDEFSFPPGSVVDILPSLSENLDKVEVALFQDHRFAFFFWLRWSSIFNSEERPPALITLDWHEDLVPPDETECQALGALNRDSPREISLFCWEYLNPLNDGHILAAAYLNLIGDIYVVRKQKDSTNGFFTDAYGRTHYIYLFDTVDDLVSSIMSVTCDRVILDIDLDYFTESSDSCGGGECVTLVSDSSIKKVLNPDGDFLSWVFPRLVGLTIATEPEFCGGIGNSNHLLSVVSKTLFYPQLLSSCTTWRHLRQA